jgi:hypothetical protein
MLIGVSEEQNKQGANDVRKTSLYSKDRERETDGKMAKGKSR